VGSTISYDGGGGSAGGGEGFDPGSASGAIGLGLGFLGGFFTPHGTGKGRLAARGQAAQAAKLQRLSMASAAIAQREASVLHDFEQRNPGQPGQLVTFNPDPSVQKLVGVIQNIRESIQTASSVRQAKNRQERLVKKEAKLARLELKKAAKLEVNVAANYGPNTGYWREFGAPPPAWLIERRV
jgi:hypothetical protein